MQKISDLADLVSGKVIGDPSIKVKTISEASTSTKEDLVFVASINKESVGEYGTYDYEIRVPVELRDYDSTDSETIYLYYDLV